MLDAVRNTCPRLFIAQRLYAIITRLIVFHKDNYEDYFAQETWFCVACVTTVTSIVWDAIPAFVFTIQTPFVTCVTVKSSISIVCTVSVTSSLLGSLNLLDARDDTSLTRMTMARTVIYSPRGCKRTTPRHDNYHYHGNTFFPLWNTSWQYQKLCPSQENTHSSQYRQHYRLCCYDDEQCSQGTICLFRDANELGKQLIFCNAHHFELFEEEDGEINSSGPNVTLILSSQENMNKNVIQFRNVHGSPV